MARQALVAKATRRQSKQRRQNAVRADARAAAAEQDQGAVAEHAILIAITLLLLSDLQPPALAARLTGILVPFGFSPAAVGALMLLLGTDHTTFTAPAGDGSALQAIERTEAARRSQYVLAALRRLEAGETKEAEKRLLNAHLRAEEHRRKAARRVDAAVSEWGTLLGWYSKKDDRTTPDCAAAHGCNFLATRPPAIGYPGMLHGGNCRCEPGPPWSQAPLLP